MAAGIAEIQVFVPHLVAVDRLPQRLTAGGVTVERTGDAGVVDVVGSLRAHVAAARWRSGRRSGDACYEVLRTHQDRCSITVVLDGLGCTEARATAEALRASLTESAPAVRKLAVELATGHRVVTRPA